MLGRVFFKLDCVDEDEEGKLVFWFVKLIVGYILVFFLFWSGSFL